MQCKFRFNLPDEQRAIAVMNLLAHAVQAAVKTA
jgi:hypothetical protein